MVEAIADSKGEGRVSENLFIILGQQSGINPSYGSTRMNTRQLVLTLTPVEVDMLNQLPCRGCFRMVVAQAMGRRRLVLLSYWQR